MKTQKGKHKKGKTLLGVYVTPEQRTIAMLTCDKLGIDRSALLLNGLLAEARRANIIDRDGKVMPECQKSYEELLTLTVFEIEKKEEAVK